MHAPGCGTGRGLWRSEPVPHLSQRPLSSSPRRAWCHPPRGDAHRVEHVVSAPGSAPAPLRSAGAEPGAETGQPLPTASEVGGRFHPPLHHSVTNQSAPPSLAITCGIRQKNAAFKRHRHGANARGFFLYGRR